MNHQYYYTSDLALATTLALWLPLEQIDKTNPRKAIFIFSQSNKLNKIISCYWEGKIKVNPLQFFTQLKIIKTKLYQ